MNCDLFQELTLIYQAIEDIWEHYTPPAYFNASGDQVYKARGLVFDLIESLGYAKEFRLWDVNRAVADEIITEAEAVPVRQHILNDQRKTK